MFQFLDTVGALQRSFITNISFVYNKDACEYPDISNEERNAVIAFRALAECPALHTLHMGFDFESLPSNSRKYSTGLMTVLDLNKLLRLRGLTTADVVLYDPRNRFHSVAELETKLQVMKRPRRS